MLTRYARTQFVDPNGDEPSDEDAAQNSAEKKFYDDSDETYSNTSDDDGHKKPKHAQGNKKLSSTSSPSSGYHIDLDHRLLLRQTKPLLQSRNASVVMAVAQLYHHVAPRQEVQIIAKALIRLLRSHKEVQSVVLTCIASMSTKRKAIFEGHVKSFFVRTSDPTHIKLLKLEILTNLASASSISLILREFQTYISSNDRPFVAATIQAIGRCAGSIKEVTETCLSGLVHLLSNRDEHVVAESVVVIKKLLQTKAAQHFDIISQMAKLLDFIKVPAARSSIIWLIGEYNEKVPKIAPDVLRKMAKTFVEEEDVVKLQVLNLSVKLFLTNPQQTSLLCQYVFTLARYDVNYDIRDRARFLKQFIFPVNSKSNVLSNVAKNVFLSAKPAPTLESKYHTRNIYQLGSLSHYLNMCCSGYNDLPRFPDKATDPAVRNVDGFIQENINKMTNHLANNQHQQHSPQKENNKRDKNKSMENSFFSESEEKSSQYSSSSESSSNSSSSASESDDENKKDTIEKSEKGKQAHEQNNVNNNRELNPSAATSKNNLLNSANDSGTSDSESSSSYGSSASSASGESSESGTESESEEEAVVKSSTKNANFAKDDNDNKKEQKSNLDLLLDLDDIPPIGPVMTPSLGGFLTPGQPANI